MYYICCMKELIQILHDEGLTLVVKSADGVVHRYVERGVKDVLTLATEHPEVLRDALVADKAVGKAAAACMVVGGVRQVYADVMSEPAMVLLHNHGILSACGQLVDHIINRSGTDWCPMERLSRDESDPAVIVDKVKAVVKR